MVDQSGLRSFFQLPPGVLNTQDVLAWMNLATAFMSGAHRSFSKKVNEIEGFANSYWAWNLSSIAASSKGTVEFRLPPGVLDAHDALA